jgi:tetratricopeptide (TPR) repeat protein
MADDCSQTPGPDARQEAESPEARPARRHKWLPRVLALALGIGLICLAEAVLCIAGYGGETAMFVRVPDGDGTESWVSNPGAFRPDFARHRVMRSKGEFPSPAEQRFPVEKNADTFRICIVGASTANGFPHPGNGSFGAYLESILNRVQDTRRVQVFIAACAALTSYSVLERLPEARDYGADMVVVYSGHNEFYGLYGAGSTLPLSTWRPMTMAQLWLRRRRLSMAVSDLLAGILPDPPQVERNKILAELMPGRTDIRFADTTYNRVRANYRANIDAMVSRALGAGMSVVLCVPACNLRDFPPLGSMHDERIGPQDLSRWETACAQARQAAEAGEGSRAVELWAEAAAASPGHALTRYELARALDRMGRHAEARDEYRAAADRDTVRWRAGSDFAEAVRTVGRDRRGDGAGLADCEAWLREHAPHRIPGRTLFLEHVHPTLEGNFRIAENIAHAIADSDAGSPLAPWLWERHRDLAFYEDLHGIDTFQRQACLRSMIEFRQTISGDDTRADPEMVDDLFALYDELTDVELAASDRAAAAYPDGGIPYDWLRICVAQEYAARGLMQQAMREMKKVRRYGNWQADNLRYADVLAAEAEILMQAGRPALAREKALQAQGLAAGNRAAARVLTATR